jgi:glutamate--cysteine ligase
LALKYRGVRYVELRSLDVNAFDPLGISETQLRFLEAFVLFCLLHDSPVVRADERAAIDHNQLEAAHRGRDPALELIVNGATRPLRQWAAELCSAMEGVCDYLDASDPARHYSRALDLQKEAVRDADRTPSARMLAEMRDNGEGFYDFARRISAQHGAYFAKFSAVPESRAVFERAATESLQRQAEMEAADDLPFDQYLARYFAQE